MTRTEIMLRDKANLERYVNQNYRLATDLIMELYKRIPNKIGIENCLFRYRKLDCNELDNLEKGTIYMRWPSSYDDDGDCAPVFDYRDICGYIFSQRGYNIEVDEKHIDAIRKDSVFKGKVQQMRDLQMIACFTEQYDNMKMWCQYADFKKGHCLVYRFSDILDEVKRNHHMSIMPVRYVDNRDSDPTIILNHKDLLDRSSEYDPKFPLTCTTKERKDYSFEEEWRLILEKERTSGDVAEGKTMAFVDPKAIILGPLVNRESQGYKELLEIANNRVIKVFRYEDLQ